MEYERACLECGKSFQSPIIIKKFCNHTCTNRYHNKKYYRKNRTIIFLKHNEWRRKNRVKLREYFRLWYNKNKKKHIKDVREDEKKREELNKSDSNIFIDSSFNKEEVSI